MLCTHKTTILCQFGLIVCHQPTNSYLHQFSTIFGGNCIMCQWMEYKQYLTIDEFYESSYNDPDKFDTKGPATEYKWKGKMNYLSPIVVQKMKCFVKWMTHEDRPYELHDDFLASLTRDNYLKFRHLDSQSFKFFFCIITTSS